MNSSVTIYTDGGCNPNPGPGGYAAIICFKGEDREACGGFSWTTNNRMEIMAVIAGLRSLTEPSRVVVYSDSRYVVDAIEKGWARKWKANDWMRSAKERALNADLWEELLSLCSIHRVSFRWLPGHSGDLLNDRCDKLTRRIASDPNLPDDPGYSR